MVDVKDVNKLVIGGAAIGFSLAAMFALKKATKEVEVAEPETVNALLGDIGGTNVRLMLKKLNLKTRTSETILDIKKYDAQKQPSLISAIYDFLN